MRVFLIVHAIACAACGGDDGPVEIRACNDSAATFDTLELGGLVGPLAPLAAGACTEYQVATGTLYRYTSVMLTAGGQQYSLQPIDFVGETPLAPGRWSYRITLAQAPSTMANIAAQADP